MESELSRPISHLFTLRLWSEPLGEGQSEWRGPVTYVLTGETAYFREWSQLHEALRRCPPEFALASGTEVAIGFGRGKSRPGTADDDGDRSETTGR